MKRKWIFVFLIFFLNSLAFSVNKDFMSLTENLTENVVEFVQTKRIPSLSIVKIKNSTNLSDNSVQKLYQMIVARLENNKKIVFKDSMIGFFNDKGKFNYRVAKTVRYLMEMTLIRNMTKIGVGVSIYSVILDKIVFYKYYEWEPKSGELRYLNIMENKFRDFGFTKIVEINTNRGLLDLITLKMDDKKKHYYFYYYDHIDVFSKENNILKKINVIRLNLKTNNYFNVIEREGRLFVFEFNNMRYLVLGNNFYRKYSVYKYKENKWVFYSNINLIPFEVFESNSEKYFIGGQYEIGKNFFKNKLIMKSLNSLLNNSNEEYYKTIDSFFSISFHKDEKKIKNFYIVNKNYNFIYYGPDFEIYGKDKGRKGYAMSLINNKWIVKTSYTYGNDDKLYFSKVNDSETKIKYSSNIKGNIIFLREGLWNNKSGIWAYIKSSVNNYNVYKLQFWSKNEL